MYAFTGVSHCWHATTPTALRHGAQGCPATRRDYPGLPVPNHHQPRRGCALVHGSVRRNLFRVHGGTDILSVVVSISRRFYSCMLDKLFLVRLPFLFLAVLSSILIWGFGCTNEVREAEAAAIATAMKHPASAEFRGLFPLNAAMITTLDRKNTPPKFIFEGIVHGRYLITMVLPLTVDRSTLHVSAVATPSFILQEFVSIDFTGGGNESSYNSDAERRFDIKEWQRLVLRFICPWNKTHH